MKLTKKQVFEAKIDILVSKLLGFETFANFLRVSVSENLVSEKKSRFRFRKIWSRKKGLGFGFRKVGLGKISRIRRIWSKKKVLVLVLGNLISEKKKLKKEERH